MYTYIYISSEISADVYSDHSSIVGIQSSGLYLCNLNSPQLHRLSVGISWTKFNKQFVNAFSHSDVCIE